jgi:hypothetical protein
MSRWVHVSYFLFAHSPLLANPSKFEGIRRREKEGNAMK